MGSAGSNYKSTIRLPQTDFPMRADLPKREKTLIARWQQAQLYHSIVKNNQGKRPFILHDGPPYANGNVHHGTILNKILKDIVVKFRNMSGRQAELIPGWDCHGLPIELQVDRELGKRKRGMSVVEVRQACRDYALGYVEVQRQQFQRLGVMADWDNAYLTMDPAYEAQVIRELGRFASSGLYKGTKPVHWCWSCRTALAEAEVEYRRRQSFSIYVTFEVVDNPEPPAQLLGKKLWCAIWTTTPWTLPANRAVAYGPSIVYKAYPFRDGYLLLASNLLHAFCEETGLKLDSEQAVSVPSGVLRKMSCRHPFLPLTLPVIPADFVRTDDGTGLVHIAPGHGPDDHVLAMRHKIPIVSPVDAAGRLTEEAGVLKGVHVFDADQGIVDLLKQNNQLLSPPELQIEHDYSHCWRCQQPVVFRATEQWFISMAKNNLRVRALEAVNRVHWIPSWGRERIHGMLAARPDWCLSRQRCWGVPVPAFYCASCEHTILDQDVINHIADLFEKNGSDIWFASEARDLVPHGFACPKCGSGNFIKENDIVDVWFESGVSFAAVCEARKKTLPVDLCLEGSDQHRGWFQSSLLSAVATRGIAPYKSILTHGFVVGGRGRKYSKSSGNDYSAQQVIDQYGAEILRLWVCATDFRTDLHLAEEVLTRMAEAYRKIRNTVRFMLGNLADFDPTTDVVEVAKLRDLDRYVLNRFGNLVSQVQTDYDHYELHRVFKRINAFVTVELSAFYFEVIKDWLYCDSARSTRRRSSQTVLHYMCRDMLSLLAPVLSFTAEEAYDFLPGEDKQPSVHLTQMPKPEPYILEQDNELPERFERLRLHRGEVLSLLEPFRAAGHHPLEGRAVIAGRFEIRDFLSSFEDLEALLSVSQVELQELKVEDGFVESQMLQGCAVRIDGANGARCARCWVWDDSVGSGKHSDLCHRCDDVISSQS